MEKIRNLFADVSQYLGAASAREKRLIGLASGAAVLFIVLLTSASFSRSIGKAQTALDEKREDFAKVEKLAVNYNTQEMERRSLEQRLQQSPAALMSFVDGLAKQEQIDIGSMSDRGAVAGGQAGKPREMQIEASLGKVSLDKLMRFLAAIERAPGVVRVRRLRMRKSSDNKEALDVSLAVSTWQAS